MIAAIAKTKVKRLALTERGARVSDQPQGQQPAEQPDRGERLEVGTAMILVTRSSRQPSHGDSGEEQPQASPLDVADL